MPAPPKVRRRGSILAGRANLLMMAAGLLLALVAGSALLVISRGH
jgi:hypothetical protein